MTAYSLSDGVVWDDLGREWPITNKIGYDGEDVDEDDPAFVRALVCGPVDGKWWTVDLDQYSETSLH